ncbi:MAG: F0F1 ATP synthase subunit B [Candidatus Spechtbacteria bacterium]|nr:F0F1 ATP synthase subunit B [Candidatus Spechtbacteria bacterium]
MSELFQNLGIKWQLLAAQVFNFFILFFVLKKFLYKPILKFLKERREAIEEGLKKSELAEEKFREMREIQARELTKTRKVAQEIVEEAKKRAEVTQKEILADAKTQSETIFLKAERDISQLKNQRLAEAEKEIGRLAIEGLEYMLKEKISDEKKGSLQEDAIAHIKAIKNAS